MNKHELLQDFAINIEKERKALMLTQKEMAERIDMSLSSYKSLISGLDVNVSVYSAYLLHQMTGKHVFELFGKKTVEAEILERFRQLSPQQKIFLQTIAECELLLHECGRDILSCIVPVNTCEDGMLWGSFTTEAILYNRKKFPNVMCGVKITSNHLHPAYILGDILLIEKRPPRDGEVGIFIHTESQRAYARKYLHKAPYVHLEPITPYGETFIVDSHNEKDMSKWIKFGVVVSKLR